MNSDILDIAEKSGLNFFGYRIPGELPRFGISPSLVLGIAEGFVIAPFLPTGQIVTIPISDCNPQDYHVNNEVYNGSLAVSTSYDRYIDGGKIILEYLKANCNAKVVYSRVIKAKREFLLSERFDAYCKDYPSAFVFCYGTSQTGLWMGCSPETLLISKDNTLHTISLAGTRLKSTNAAWDVKNIEEQRIVTNYIVDVLRSNGLTPMIGQTFTKEAGPVEHICTPIKADVSAITLDKKSFIEKLVKEFSPTPALAGYPKDEALKIISSCEDYERKCYGGFVGPYNNDRDFSFFVNLRSMKINQSEINLFVGGGYTHLSQPSLEWKETEIKAKTLLSI
jgi:isochorismate synthase